MTLDLHEKIGEPVIIEAIELLGWRGHHFVRARSKDGAEGVMKANMRLQYMTPFLRELVIPFFIGSDARDLERLVADIYTYRNNYKYTGLMLWNSVAHVEVALFDLLGKIAGLPVGALLGEVYRKEIPVYISSLTRATTPEEEIDWLEARLAESGCRAVKLKIGGRMSNNADAMPGRTAALIPLARARLGPDVAIYVDGNSSYDAPTAIEIGHMLEAHAINLFEEPCPFEDNDATKAVADALTLAVSGGEQENSLARFRSMIRHRVVDVIQPDILYNGGFIRTMQVAAMAADAGLNCTPHSPTSDANTAYMLHLASVMRNSGPYQEYHGTPRKPADWYTPSFDVANGVVPVPIGPGLGVDYDPAVWREADLL